MTTRRKCGCTFTSSNDAEVRNGFTLSGAPVSECEQHRAEREAAYAVRLSTPAADYECRAHACRRVRVEMEARNAEQAADLKEWREAAQQGARVAERCLERLKAKDAKLTALLDGIEGLEKEWRRVTDPYTKGIVGRCADYLKDLREKANGSQGAVPSTRPWPGKCIK